jgi:hypothetical protein
MIRASGLVGGTLGNVGGSSMHNSAVGRAGAGNL